MDHFRIPRPRGVEGVPQIGSGPLMAMSHWTLHEFDTDAMQWRPTGLVFLEQSDAEYVGARLARSSQHGILVMPFFPGFDGLRRRRLWRRRWVVLHYGDGLWRDTGLSFHRKRSAQLAALSLRAKAKGMPGPFSGTYLAVPRRQANPMTSPAGDAPSVDSRAQQQPPA